MLKALPEAGPIGWRDTAKRHLSRPTRCSRLRTTPIQPSRATWLMQPARCRRMPTPCDGVAMRGDPHTMARQRAEEVLRDQWRLADSAEAVRARQRDPASEATHQPCDAPLMNLQKYPRHGRREQAVDVAIMAGGVSATAFARKSRGAARWLRGNIQPTTGRVTWQARR